MERSEQLRRGIHAMYKIAVCDDNPADADYVADIIRRWAQACAVLMEIERFSLRGGILVSV